MCRLSVFVFVDGPLCWLHVSVLYVGLPCWMSVFVVRVGFPCWMSVSVFCVVYGWLDGRSVGLIRCVGRLVGRLGFDVYTTTVARSSGLGSGSARDVVPQRLPTASRSEGGVANTQENIVHGAVGSDVICALVCCVGVLCWLSGSASCVGCLCWLSVMVVCVGFMCWSSMLVFRVGVLCWLSVLVLCVGAPCWFVVMVFGSLDGGSEGLMNCVYRLVG